MTIQTEQRTLTIEEQRDLLNEEVQFSEYDDMDKNWNFFYNKELWTIPIELTFNPNYAKKLLIEIMIEDEVLRDEVIEVLI